MRRVTCLLGHSCQWNQNSTWGTLHTLREFGVYDSPRIQETAFILTLTTTYCWHS